MRPRADRRAGRPAWCTVWGGEREPAKEDLAHYFRAVEAALRETLRDQRAPLILAGVQYLLPIYREVSSYGYIAKEELPGKPDHLAEHELHSRSWPLIKSRLADAQQEAVAKYRKLAGTGKTSDDLPQRSFRRRTWAKSKRFSWIWRLIAGASSTPPTERSPNVRQRLMAAGDDDLLDLAAAQTLLHRRGAVIRRFGRPNPRAARGGRAPLLGKAHHGQESQKGRQGAPAGFSGRISKLVHEIGCSSTNWSLASRTGLQLAPSSPSKGHGVAHVRKSLVWTAWIHPPS